MLCTGWKPRCFAAETDRKLSTDDFIWLGSSWWVKFRRFFFSFPSTTLLLFFFAQADKTFISWAFLRSLNHTLRTPTTTTLSQRAHPAGSEVTARWKQHIKINIQTARPRHFLYDAIALRSYCFFWCIHTYMGAESSWNDGVCGETCQTIFLHYTAI